MAKDISEVTAIKDGEGKLLVQAEQVRNRWKTYFDEFLNVENEREELEEVGMTEGPILDISMEEVRGAVAIRVFCLLMRRSASTHCDISSIFPSRSLALYLDR